MAKPEINKEQKIRQLLEQGVEQVVEKDNLATALHAGKKLRVKMGIDPTSPDLHLGHAVGLRKMREFQDLGHKAVFIIGDFTAQIGDPSGRSAERKPLSSKEIKENMKKYLAQAAKVIDVKKAEIHHNSTWFSKGGAALVVQLAAAGSIQQVLHRADFKKRLEENNDITLLETLYPLFQGYDSVAVKADVELGGTDQTFNLLMGRRVQRHFGMKEQDILTVPLLEGLDGVKKMSKSLGNYIALGDAPNDMFGKIMSVPDALIERYFTLCTKLTAAEIHAVLHASPPRDQKIILGLQIVEEYFGKAKAEAAKSHFVQVFSKKETPDDAPVLKIKSGQTAVQVVVTSGIVESNSEAWRLVIQGGFKVNDATEQDPRKPLELRTGDVLKIGKRHFFRVKT